MRTYIHVNQHVIKSNRLTGANDPVLTVKTYKSNTYAHEVVINGPSKVVYSADKPLSCGARVWIETSSDVVCFVHSTDAEVVHDRVNEVHLSHQGLVLEETL